MAEEEKEALLTEENTKKSISDLILKINEVEQTFLDLVDSRLVTDVRNFLKVKS